MKIVIIGAGSMAFAPALLGGFSRDRGYESATVGLVDLDEASLGVIERLTRRISDDRDLGWTVQASTDRLEALADADLVTTAIGVGGIEAFALDLEIPSQYGCVQAVGDTTGPGGLSRALRHVPVLVDIARDMEALCPRATLYNFTNPLTVLTQAVNQLTRIRCIGLCIGVDLTWRHICQVVGVPKRRTSVLAGGLNHCHWILDLQIDGESAFPVLDAALDEAEGDAASMSELRRRLDLADRHDDAHRDAEPLCEALYRRLGCYPGPGDWHVSEFFPQFIQSTPARRERFAFDRAYLRHVRQAHPAMMEKMAEMADYRTPLDEAIFGGEIAWEHTQLLDILRAQVDDLGEIHYVNLPNRGYIHNLPDGTVVEVPARVDAEGLHPIALGDLPAPILPPLARQAASLDLIIQAAMEGSRTLAVQAFVHDSYCTDLELGRRLINELIDAQVAHLPAFR